MTDKPLEEEKQKVLVAYVLQNAPATYWGELATDEDLDEYFYLSKPMVLVMNPKTNETHWSKAIACGKDSLLMINSKLTPGILVFHPDEELISAYKSEYTQAYTKLALFRP